MAFKIMGYCAECNTALRFYGRSGKEAWFRCMNANCPQYRKQIIFKKGGDDVYRKKKETEFRDLILQGLQIVPKET